MRGAPMRARKPSAAQLINAYVTSEGPVCDKFVQKAVGLAQPNQVSPFVTALATTSEFAREHGKCQVCSATKVVTRAITLL